MLRWFRRGRTGQSSTEIRSILVFCLPGIGDTLLASPVFRALKEALPQARITALTMIQGANDVLRTNPYVDENLHFNFMGQGAWKSLRFVFGLRHRRFDASILTYPSNRLEYNVIAWLARARLRVGHRYTHMNTLCGNFLSTHSVREDDALSNVEENLRLAEVLTGPSSFNPAVEFPLTSEVRSFASNWLVKHKIHKAKTIVGFHPGGSTAKNHVWKRWPRESFIQLGKKLCDEAGVTILVFGGEEEDELQRDVAYGIGTNALVVKTNSILEMSGILNRCSHVVTNDSAVLHLAGALRVPTTGVFGPTSAPWVRIPGAPRDEILTGLDCQPCFYYSPRHLTCKYGDFRCLKQLAVERVATSVLKSLSAIPIPEAVAVVATS